MSSDLLPLTIYVNDELIDEYKRKAPAFADSFKPLSEYKANNN